MEGLRTQESNKFEMFFSFVQEEAKKQNCIFFLDSGDGNDFCDDICEGENLMGWLIPYDKKEIFKKEFLNGDVSDDWSDFFVWAVWEMKNGLKIHFESE